jgi:hypothetical protein
VLLEITGASKPLSIIPMVVMGIDNAIVIRAQALILPIRVLVFS